MAVGQVHHGLIDSLTLGGMVHTINGIEICGSSSWRSALIIKRLNGTG
jgi:hypothetical protein